MKSHRISDQEIEEAFLGTNFGVTGVDAYRKLLVASVMKKLVGYHCGHTITTIMKKMELIGVSEKVLIRGILFVRNSDEFFTATRYGG